jgi:uncharacterized membrane protein
VDTVSDLTGTEKTLRGFGVAEGSEFKAESFAGLALALIAAAMAAFGVQRPVWVVVLCIGVILLGVAAIRWSHRDDPPS